MAATKDQDNHSSESDFEFIQTPKAATPTFEKFEECGVKTTNVSTASFRSELMHKNNYTSYDRLDWLQC